MGVGLVLSKALCFIGIILLGYALRRIGFFKEEDFSVLSKIVLKITLPAAIISSFANKEVDVGMLSLSLLGFLCGVVYMLLAYLMYRRGSREQRGFAVMNEPGYNIGNFTLPFVQSFLGPMGVITTSLFDAGNAIICLGGAYSMAGTALGGGNRLSPLSIGKKLLGSVPFDAYLLMTIFAILHIPVPFAVTQFAEIIGQGNAFLAMLMIGVGFHLSGDHEQKETILRILGVRYLLAILLAFAFYYLLPFGVEVRQTLCILVFAPIGSAAPAFTADLKLDVGLSSAINSLSIVISICCIVAALLILL